MLLRSQRPGPTSPEPWTSRTLAQVCRTHSSAVQVLLWKAEWTRDFVGTLPRHLRMHGKHLPLAHGRSGVSRPCRQTRPEFPDRLEQREHRRMARRRTRRPANARSAREPWIRRLSSSGAAVHRSILRRERPGRRARPHPRANPPRVGTRRGPGGKGDPPHVIRPRCRHHGRTRPVLRSHGDLPLGARYD